MKPIEITIPKATKIGFCSYDCPCSNHGQWSQEACVLRAAEVVGGMPRPGPLCVAGTYVLLRREQYEAMCAACKKALAFVAQIHTFRDADGNMPFGTVDYYGMEDLMVELGIVLAVPVGEPQPEAGGEATDGN